MLVAPALLVAAATLLPLLYLFLRAQGASGGFIGYLLRPQTAEVLGRTLLLVAGVSLASLLVALPIAYLTTRTRLPGRQLWFVLAVLPLVIPSYVGAYAYVSAFATGGLVREWIGLTLPVYGYWGALLVMTLVSYPYLLLTLRAGLHGLDPKLEEASRSLGRSSWTTFMRVTLPLLRPAIAAGMLLVALYVLSDFGAVSMLRYNTFTRAIYIQYENSFNRSNAAVLSTMLVSLTGALLLLDNWLRGRGRIGQGGVGASRKAVQRSLGVWTAPAILYMVTVVLLALIAPIGIIVAWLLRGIAAGQSFALDWSTVVNAAGVSAVSALTALLAAVPVALLAVRFPSRLSASVERLTYVGYALPGIVVALALVFFGVRFVPWAYQSLAMLVFAYLLLFLPQAVGNLRASLLQLDPSLEEASRGLGRPPLYTLSRITLPLLKSGLVTSAALVFLTTMKELPATLLLRPTGFDTLATEVWSWTIEAFFAQAAPYALLLILVSSLSVGLLLWQDRR
ncbi:MAG: iron ABC transporter permease [Trueperaceae bacterium]